MNKFLIYQIILLLTLQGCKDQTQDQNDIVTINGVTINQKILNELKKKLNQEPIEFEKVNYHYENVDSTWKEETDTIRNGFYFKQISEFKAKRIIQDYSEELTETGHYMFLKNLEFDDNWNSLYDVTIVKAENQYDILKIMNTQGPNYDVTNEQVITKVKKWDEKVGLKIIVADEARVEAFISKLPDDLLNFTQEIYELCPDVIEQGYSDMDEMINDYKTNKYFWMWWD
ncbi:DUF4253 domain-containing protein [Robertkochia solimangrovi]|uniref:DUF4253 domain-containing protein n=1 Tax=Robertkochia solimangrovi TaxID=2213046 RepID=UPI0011801085|nr:DUF4253 domain-containing protein [Robertkochia solimangrovi]TRZ45122.1 hypothetical protein DMZ48_05060 [Robertkochia solimangrovi]